jgi:hypothetical protein
MAVRRPILIAAMTCAIALCFDGARARDELPPVFDAQASAAAQAARYVDVKGHQLVAGAKRVAIVSFTVEFFDSLEASPEPSPSSAKGKKDKKDEEDIDQPATGVAASVAISLDPAQLQAIVDALYDAAVENWRAAGVEVLAPDAMAQIPGLADVRSRLATSPYRGASTDSAGRRTSIIVSAHGRPAYADAAADSAVTGEIAASKRAGVLLVTAHSAVDFVALRDTDERLFRKKLAPAYVQVVRARETQYRVVSPDGGVSRAILRNPVRAPESPIIRGRLGGYDDAAQVEEQDGKQVERLAVNASVYYDQSLRYLSAAEDMLTAALGLD